MTPANSGSAGAPITYMPYNNEKVVIDGADPVTGWTLYNNGASGSDLPGADELVGTIMGMETRCSSTGR